MFDDIRQTFGNLLRKVRSTSADTSTEDLTSEDVAHSRSKRQTTNIGDESPHPYEIRASRLRPVVCLIHKCIQCYQCTYNIVIMKVFSNGLV